MIEVICTICFAAFTIENAFYILILIKLNLMKVKMTHSSIEL